MKYFNPELRLLIFGATFGQLFVNLNNYEWTVFVDHIGEELCVINKKTGQYVFPFSIVRKRVRKKKFNFFSAIYQKFEDSDRKYYQE